MESTQRLYIPTRSDKLGLRVEVQSVVVDHQTKFQRIQVLDTLALGRVLLLDGHVQLAEIGEHAYHESLVQVPAMSVPNLRSALVVGGGDGGVLRELCRHECLQHVDMVEIDREVVDVCREMLPEVSGGAFDDARVHLHIEDAFKFVKSTAQKYDLIIVDCTDVYEEEDEALSEDLFTHEFYSDLARLLNPGGFVVTQADNLVFCRYTFDEAYSKFQKAFVKSGQYWAMVPSFGGFSGFVWGSNDATVSHDFKEERVPSGLRYLDATTYALGMSPVPFVSKR